MNIVEQLLAVDAGALQMPSKDVTLKLGKLGGQEFIFTCKAVNPEKIAKIQNKLIDLSKKGNIQGTNLGETKLLTVMEGCNDVFRNKELLSHFNAPTPKELINKLLLAGEIDELYSTINELNGFEDEEDEEEEIKN
ncbi:XkdN-like protein [Clostridium botulinum D/C]|uniref:phage tail assembly chaperone n=1 Tax=Clostridium botulinum TaxID=1491 RepID=UPI001E53EE0C|nr:XkdN-like protein [Clostridium botulinum]MCD3234327.1 XkdN-like protein [Clostridium botulinum D/C]MCD3240311.1 XkdN-like protein [Clostridium botulinum D/C]MCD3267746.1 XkdN-like protein [Clostridium botulinum D/C]MCD3306143.1 XkdN-like protein [Clostridium botulinum D/C]MCD3314927.1 XkdN-like protein [Clostridium botulinum D/C]